MKGTWRPIFWTSWNASSPAATRHLLANMRQAVERWLHTIHARLRRLPVPSAGKRAAPVPARRDQAFRRTEPERAVSAAGHARWQARYDEVRRRHLAGEPLLAIARAMDLARGTVRKFACAESFPARLPHGPGPSILDPYAEAAKLRPGQFRPTAPTRSACGMIHAKRGRNAPRMLRTTLE